MEKIVGSFGDDSTFLKRKSGLGQSMEDEREFSISFFFDNDTTIKVVTQDRVATFTVEKCGHEFESVLIIKDIESENPQVLIIVPLGLNLVKKCIEIYENEIRSTMNEPDLQDHRIINKGTWGNLYENLASFPDCCGLFVFKGRNNTIKYIGVGDDIRSKAEEAVSDGLDYRAIQSNYYVVGNIGDAEKIYYYWLDLYHPPNNFQNNI